MVIHTIIKGQPTTSTNAVRASFPLRSTRFRLSIYLCRYLTAGIDAFLVIRKWTRFMGRFSPPWTKVTRHSLLLGVKGDVFEYFFVRAKCKKLYNNLYFYKRISSFFSGFFSLLFSCSGSPPLPTSGTAANGGANGLDWRMYRRMYRRLDPNWWTDGQTTTDSFLLALMRTNRRTGRTKQTDFWILSPHLNPLLAPLPFSSFLREPIYLTLSPPTYE